MIETRGRHPGVTLHEDFISPLKMSDRLFSVKAGIALRLVALLRIGRTPITRPIADKLAGFFPETTVEQWMFAQRMWNEGKA